jgi:hypothetical protein
VAVTVWLLTYHAATVQSHIFIFKSSDYLVVSHDTKMADTKPPEKYHGYAASSILMNKTDGHTIFRRFGELHVRNLLHMQCQISDLETRLHIRDNKPGNHQDHGTFRYDQDEVRRALMKQLQLKLKQYGK